MFGKDLTTVGNFIMESGELSNSMSMVLISLIPKKSNSTKIQDLKPISLINVTIRLLSSWKEKALQKVIRKLINKKQPRGTRQRNPLSPLLFNICLEMLLQSLDEKLEGFHLNDILGKGDLVYADDLLIFLSNESDQRQFQTLINKFEIDSGLKVSIAKTTVFHRMGLDCDKILPYQYSLFNQEYYYHLGIPMKISQLDYNPWKEYLKSIKYHIKSIPIMDLNILQITKLMNVYVYSKLYYRDLHFPMEIEDMKQIEYTIQQKTSSKNSQIQISGSKKERKVRVTKCTKSSTWSKSKTIIQDIWKSKSYLDYCLQSHEEQQQNILDIENKEINSGSFHHTSRKMVSKEALIPRNWSQYEGLTLTKFEWQIWWQRLNHHQIEPLGSLECLHLFTLGYYNHEPYYSHQSSNDSCRFCE
ncbi:uncharacterized protein KGF55_000941 [Candida pseudojiufengensis]|uniref:uncharacterized protein n=1 Tax=Candida pseudojiufengensis TaxID=497109 RepID=UPI002225700A|nr:uncharacterized protein KGF55_000941 [Candida pseudojiufengensis]KAI5965579.1 hypothetical protein KGF55_000941 [Candida pseudojiufengensis]